MQALCQALAFTQMSTVTFGGRGFATIFAASVRMSFDLLSYCDQSFGTPDAVPNAKMAQHKVCQTQFKGRNVEAISLDTAILITGISKRTLWRRVTEGQLTRLDTDERGRAMLAFSEIALFINIPIEPEDYELLVEADAGDAEAQNDLAQLLIDIDLLEIGMHWLKLAVEQEHPDAMHNLAKLYIKGQGVPKDQNTGLMYLAKAAAHGHIIAQQQMAALMPGQSKN